MEKEFVPYEQALALKELGFDEKCILDMWWFNEKDITFKTKFTPTYYMNEQSSEILNFDYKIPKKHPLPKGHSITLLIPTFSQAFRFFREKYGLEGITQRAEDWLWYKWTIHQYNENGKKYVADRYEYETYEEAELACLIFLIDIVKNK